MISKSNVWLFKFTKKGGSNDMGELGFIQVSIL